MNVSEIQNWFARGLGDASSVTKKFGLREEDIIWFVNKAIHDGVSKIMSLGKPCGHWTPTFNPKVVCDWEFDVISSS